MITLSCCFTPHPLHSTQTERGSNTHLSETMKNKIYKSLSLRMGVFYSVLDFLEQYLIASGPGLTKMLDTI